MQKEFFFYPSSPYFRPVSLITIIASLQCLLKIGEEKFHGMDLGKAFVNILEEMNKYALHHHPPPLFDNPPNSFNEQ